MTNTRHVATTLAVALGASTSPTTLTPLSYTGFPAAGQGTLSVGNSQIPASVEIVAVTNWATHPWPILRAQDGSTAVSHAIGDGVATVLSETSLGGLVGVYEGGTLVANTTEPDLDASDFDVVLTGGKAAIALAGTLTGTFTGSASPNLLTVPASATPAPTAEGELWWDSNDDRLVVGTGGGTSSPLATAADLTGFGNATGGTFAHPIVSDYEELTDQGGDPSSPASGTHRVYAKAGGVYVKSSAGAVVGPLAAGSGAFVGASARHSTDQTTADFTLESLELDTDIIDTDGFHDTSTNNSRLTIPSGKDGYYLAGGSAKMTATPGALYLVKNGSTLLAICDFSGAAGPNAASVSALVSLVATDYLELQVFQQTGGAATIEAVNPGSPFLWCYKVG